MRAPPNSCAISPTAASSGGPNDMWRLRDEICNSAYAFLLSRSLACYRPDRLLPCVGEPCTRDLRETTCMAGAGDWLAVNDCATGTHGFCAAVHLDAHPDVELRQWQRGELYPICTDGVRHQSGTVHSAQYAEGARWRGRLLHDCEVSALRG